MFHFKHTNPYNSWIKFSSSTDLNGSFAKWKTLFLFHLAIVERLFFCLRVFQSFWNDTKIYKSLNIHLKQGAWLGFHVADSVGYKT